MTPAEELAKAAAKLVEEWGFLPRNWGECRFDNSGKGGISGCMTHYDPEVENFWAAYDKYKSKGERHE